MLLVVVVFVFDWVMMCSILFLRWRMWMLVIVVSDGMLLEFLFV